MGPQALVILDGLGYRADTDGNALAHARTPAFDQLLTHYPWTTLHASGTAVGLMKGQPGNSSVGHFTLGTGTIVQQPLTQLTELERSGKLGSLPIIHDNFTKLTQTNKQLHILCLASDGDVYSRLEHTLALITIAAQYRIPRILVHALLDGRDVPQRSAAGYLQRIQNILDELPAHTHGVIATLQGRLYGMNHNENHGFIEQSFQLLTQPSSHTVETWQEVLARAYQQKLIDEQIPPAALIENPCIQPGDGLIFPNIRTDHGSELIRLLKQDKDLSFVITGIPDLVPAPHVDSTLMHELELHGKTLFSIAESEKAAHISYFFNGGNTEPQPHEKRIIVPSDSSSTFIENPRMKADTITRYVRESLLNDPRDFYLIHYANADMVGHTGNLKATARAIECIDEQLAQLNQLFVVERRGTLYITADHGNAEDKRHGSPSHTTNPVYFIAVRNPPIPEEEVEQLIGLSDVKNFILKNI